jgi:O-acetyl-ADP-ribose deacetylase (regulator of RNase III)
MIAIVKDDITTLAVDAIVNAANADLVPGAGVSGAIHHAAGPELRAACLSIGHCDPGGAVITPGFVLPAKFVIHAVGPQWRGGRAGEREMLRHTYGSIFRVARANPGIRTMAIPAISTGIFGFPRDAAAEIAVAVMRLHESAMERIVACLFDDESVRLYERALARTTSEGP